MKPDINSRDLAVAAIERSRLRREWLAGLKVGDPVIVAMLNMKHPGTVAKVTPKQLVCSYTPPSGIPGTFRCWRESGRGVAGYARRIEQPQ